MKNKNGVKIVSFAILLILAIIWLAPMIWVIFSTFRSEVEIQTTGFSLLPAKWVLTNYMDLLTNVKGSSPIVKWFINSLFVSTSHTILVLIVSSMAAYGYSRLKFRGREVLFWFLLSTMMFPSVVNLIPSYKIVDSFGWINTMWALVIPGLGGVGNIYLMRQFMIGIPVEYDESARVDGATTWQIYSRIILPLSKPIMIVVALFTFSGSWNDFLWPSIVMNDLEKFTLTPGLQTLQSTLQNDVAHLLTAGVISIVPTLILYLIAQKYFVEGLSLNSGVKG